ncbi:Ca2+-dependent phosphoinositide-specific phospholipase C [Endozoicomonas atrinae]|uniref:Ca2+-dependent phosphoinositide-specific phospholipase C n=1 Tax=Endozoicomonas atrinae TaxID=1333660 RepID=UPI003B00733F
MLSLDYAHVSLTEQFEAQGIRQIELDVFHDPEGGRYKNRGSFRIPDCYVTNKLTKG